MRQKVESWGTHEELLSSPPLHISEPLTESSSLTDPLVLYGANLTENRYLPINLTINTTIINIKHFKIHWRMNKLYQI